MQLPHSSAIFHGWIDKRTQQFETFHKANPWVLISLLNLTVDLVNKGRTKIGMGMLFEVLRWDYIMRTIGDEFKLNNNYRAYYSRLIEDQYPQYKGVFTKRTSWADKEQGE